MACIDNEWNFTVYTFLNLQFAQSRQGELEIESFLHLGQVRSRNCSSALRERSDTLTDSPIIRSRK